MSDIFDIDGQYRNNRNVDSYKNHRNSWVSEEHLKSPKDPRLSRRDDGLKQFPRNNSSHQRTQHSASPTRDGGWQKNQMYNQNQHYQTVQSSMYSEQYNSGYGATSGYDYQTYQQNRPDNFTQYNQSNYDAQGYNSGHPEPGPPGDDYPPGTWATSNYSTSIQPPPPQPSSMAAPNTYIEPMKDDLKKEAAIAQELKQQRATLIKQRDEYLRKASVLRRELEKLRVQKNELLLESSPPRESQRILRENAKLQLEIQNKLKSIRNVVDMLSGIIGDGLKWSEEEARSVGGDSDDGPKEEETAKFNYIHYDPELHWCRICDVFPSSAKDFLNHLHCNEHKLVTHEHQLVDTPWHKLPSDAEIPCTKGAPIKRIPIKGLQFFISAPAWYCKLCDVWIGDLHCASLHLKSKNHAHNYSNFVEQNPHWETNWLKDRETAYTRCLKQKTDLSVQPPESATAGVSERSKNRKNNKHGFLEGSSKDKRRKKKSKKRKKNSSASSSSSSSSSSNSSSEDDKAKSIRVAMRNKMRMQAQLILNEEIGGKLEALGKLVEERSRKIDDEKQSDTTNEDNIINQWMTVNPQNDKQIFDNLKGRLKQRQKADEGKAMEAAIEQRRKEREREERELRELREREQREIEQKMRNEEGREREHEERERKENYRRKHRSESRSPESYNRRRSRSRSSNRRHYRSGPRSPDSYHEERKNDPYLQEREFKPRPKKIHEEEREESTFDKHKTRTSVSSSSSNSRKLPFIGRMPLFKKKPESSVDGEKHHSGNKKRLDYQIRLSKFESGTTARAFIPEPGVVHITKLATPLSPNLKLSAENPPPPPQIIPEPPQISESPPPPPMINNTITAVDETSVQDMELDEAVAPIPPGVPPSEAKPIVRPAGNHLPRDFQEALSIIYPTEQHPDYLAMQQDPNLMLQYQYQYQMMYSGMQMYDYANNHTDNPAPPTSESKENEIKVNEEELKPPPPPEIDDKEDLAMLGIDEEDITAQNF